MAQLSYNTRPPRSMVLVFNLVSLNVARPDTPSQARGTSLGVWVEPGYLVRETAARLALSG